MRQDGVQILYHPKNVDRYGQALRVILNARASAANFWWAISEFWFHKWILTRAKRSRSKDFSVVHFRMGRDHRECDTGWICMSRKLVNIHDASATSCAGKAARGCNDQYR